jgi:hypothetical protein
MTDRDKKLIRRLYAILWPATLERVFQEST